MARLRLPPTYPILYACVSKLCISDTLLPVGYPHSVAPEYMHYQLWDTLQVLCDDLRGAVTAQAALLAIGAGGS